MWSSLKSIAIVTLFYDVDDALYSSKQIVAHVLTFYLLNPKVTIRYMRYIL